MISRSPRPEGGASPAVRSDEYRMEEGNERELDTLTEPGIKGLKRGNLRRILLLLGILVMALLGLRQGLRMQTATVEPTQLPKQDAVFQPVILPHRDPRPTFAEQLSVGSSYLTSFGQGGLSNQLLELFKLVHLAEKLDRTAVLPDLFNEHDEGYSLPYSTFFDLPSFSAATNASMVEWAALKIKGDDSAALEFLSCWGSDLYGERLPLAEYKVFTTAFATPPELVPPFPNHFSFSGVTVLVSTNQSSWTTPLSLTLPQVYGVPPPSPNDSPILCFMNLFYIRYLSFINGEIDLEYGIAELDPQGPVWREVGRYLYFNPAIEDLTTRTLQTLLGPSYVPPLERKVGLEKLSRKEKMGRAGTRFIAVHLRRGDFVKYGWAKNTLASYVAAVATMQGKLRPSSLFHVGEALPVLFATDSEEPEFLAECRAQGWTMVDHEKLGTAANYGGWHPGVIDSVILSRAVGFIGSSDSSFSFMAVRRVEEWVGGFTYVVGGPVHKASN